MSELRALIAEMRDEVEVDEASIAHHIKSAFHKLKAKLKGKKIPKGHSPKKFHPSATADVRQSMARSRAIRDKYIATH